MHAGPNRCARWPLSCSIFCDNKRRNRLRLVERYRAWLHFFSFSAVEDGRFRTNCRQSPLLLSLMGCIGEKSRMAVVCLECCRFEIDLLIAKILEI